MAFQASPQQQAFIDFMASGRGSCNLIAVAGAGKTTSLMEGIQATPGQVAVMVYNKKNGLELQQKLEARGIDWRKAQAGTVHSFCFNAWRKVAPSVKVDGKKMQAIWDQMAQEFPGIEGYQSFVLKAVSMAKQRAFGVLGSIDDLKLWHDMVEHFGMDEDLCDEEGNAILSLEMAIEIAQGALDRSIRLNHEVIDFDDMIFAPLFHRARFWKFDVVMVDEAQDTNPARRAAVRAMLKPGGRVVAVGDPRQAIYGFTGADADSMDLIAKDFNSIELPLTTTFRCPKKVVAFAQQWVSHIQAAETAPEGEVLEMTMDEFLELNSLSHEDAVLCRNTKQLVALAYTLLRKGVACMVEGKEIGQGLIKLATRWSRVKTLEALRNKLDSYQEKETTKWLAKGQEEKAAGVEDRVQTLVTLIDSLQKEGKQMVNDLVCFINKMFGDTPEGEKPRVLTLSTIHKSKGLQWRRVFMLARAQTLPSKYARKAWQLRAEENLQYVMATRAMETLVDLT